MKNEIVKLDEDKHLVFGFASIADTRDLQDDLIPEDELERAAYEYVVESREGAEMHQRRNVATLVESMFFSVEKQQLLGLDLGAPSWWIGFKVTDEEVWDKIKKHEYQAFSIRGTAIKERI